jgi:Rrf2 family protein
MRLITRSTDYAIRAVCYMAKEQKGVVSVTELTRALRMPRPFLRKILQSLTKDGLVRSYKGIGGGFELAVPAGRIRVADIVRVFQGPLALNECFFKKRACPNRRTCPLKKRLDGIARRAEDELGSITVRELIKGA